MIRAGLIGCGFIASKHVKTLSRFDAISIAAVCDIQEERMKAVADLYQQQKGDHTSIALYQNYQDLLMQSDIDIVIISVVSGLHAEIARQALKSGKHVVIEKPLALSLADAAEINQLSRQYNKKVLVCHQLRYRPLMQKMKELIDDGYFGDLYLGIASMRLHRSTEYYTTSPWKGTWEKDGGMLINQGIHLTDLLIWFLGDIVSAYGEIANYLKDKETEDVATGILSFQSKSKGVIEANTISKPENIGYYLSLFGEKGSICINGNGLNKISHCYMEDYPQLEKELKEISVQTDDRYLMYKDFIQAIETNGEHLMTVSEAKKSLEAIFAIYQSDKSKKPIIFPMEDFSTMDMLHE